MIDTTIGLKELNNTSSNNMVGHLGIVYTELNENSISAKMPVNEKTKQPLGILHGGANIVLAETLGSVAANLSIDSNTHYAAGIEINANHIKSVKDGFVFGIAKPLHTGKTTQVWEVFITNDNNELCCISRLTVSILKK